MRGLSSRPLMYRDYRSALNSAIGWHWIGQQDRAARLLDLATGIISGISLEDILEFPVRLQEVSEEGVADVIRRVFNQEKSVIMRVRANPPQP
jgi:predicted Zn-dependent peptidase